MSKNEGKFSQGMGLFDATSLVAGGMIGSGIFVVSQDIALQVGAPGWLLAVWLLTALMTLAVALSYGELAAMYPGAGGQYIYLRESYSPLVGFLYGWTSFLVIQTGTIAAVAVVFAKYLGVLFPAISTSHWLWHTGHIGVSTAQLVAIGVIALLTANNCINLNAGKRVQNVFTVAKIGSLALLVVAGVAFRAKDGAWTEAGFFTRHATGGGLSTPLFAAIFTAMVGSMFSSDAWNNITFVAGEVRNPRRNLPLSLALGAGGVVLLYFLVNCAYLAMMPFSAIAGAPEARVAAAALTHALPAWPGGVVAISVVVMVSTFGCLNGLILSGPRLYWAMAHDGLFFKSAGHLGEKSGVPSRGLVLQGLWAALLTLSGTYSDLLDYVIFAALLFYVLTVIGVFVLRLKLPSLKRPYRAWGYPVVPALYIASAATMMSVLLMYKPLYTWPGLGIVALGVPVYFGWQLLHPARSRR